MLGLVLGGGAAKGYAHIGALKVLEEMDIKPDIIVGASMGAVIGGFYAAGFGAKELEDICIRVDKKKKRWLFKPHLSKRGLFDGKNIVKYLRTYLQGKTIEELPVKFACIAMDIEDHTMIIINKGDLLQAIRAVISIPGIFTPHEYAGRVLIDGGFVNPVPITAAQELGAQKIIAFNVVRRVDYRQSMLSPKTPTSKTYNMKQVLGKTIDYVISRLIDYELMHLKNGILININTKGIGLSQFEKAREAIDRGYQEVQKHRKDLKRLVH